MFVTRFAPSPTGRLHKGHAFSALTAWGAAHAAGGRFLLRIEDIDPTRCRPEFETGDGPGGERGLIRARPETAGDVVVARKDAGAAYHVAVTHDDDLQGVTHVIRGQDLFEAAHVQVLLQALMGWPTPVYRHHRLLTGEDGRRLAKRDQSVTLAQLRADGVSPVTLRAELGF